MMLGISTVGAKERAVLLPALNKIGELVGGADFEEMHFAVPRHSLGRGFERLGIGSPDQLRLGLERHRSGEVIGGWIAVSERDRALTPDIFVDSGRAYTSLSDNGEIIPPSPLDVVIADLTLRAVVRHLRL
jgi:hypothetical protein